MSLGKPVSSELAARIRAVHAKEPELTLAELAERFGVSRGTVFRVLHPANGNSARSDA